MVLWLVLARALLAVVVCRGGLSAGTGCESAIQMSWDGCDETTQNWVGGSSVSESGWGNWES